VKFKNKKWKYIPGWLKNLQKRRWKNRSRPNRIKGYKYRRKR